MCIAILQKENKVIPREVLLRCFDKNSDGCGILYVNSETNKLEVEKTLTFEVFYKQYENITSKHGNKPMIVHFRFGTHGKKNLNNCHPFMVSDTIGFVHNGILSDSLFDNQNKDYSDTWHFNEQWLKEIDKVEDIRNPFVHTLLGSVIGTSNKLCFLDSDGKYYIVNESSGVWDDNAWYSNTGYKPVEKYTYENYDYYDSRSWNKENTLVCWFCKTRHSKFNGTLITFHGFTEIWICYTCMKEKMIGKLSNLYEEAKKEKSKFLS